jgi:Family of unknown function (DUF6982)
MPIQTAAASQRSMVVVALLAGERLKGYVYDFSTLKDAFNLAPQQGTLAERGMKLELKDVKAVFFVKDFDGNRDHKPNASEAAPLQHGRKLEVTFADGEKIVGTTEAYNPQKLGFFMVPADAESNNLRVFVVNKNVRGVKFL